MSIDKPTSNPPKKGAAGKSPAALQIQSARQAPARGKEASPSKTVENKSAATTKITDKSSRKNNLRESILAHKAPAKPIAFSMEEVRALAQQAHAKGGADEPVAGKRKSSAASEAASLAKAHAPAKPNHVHAASLADILGLAPGKPKHVPDPNAARVPEKYKPYYKLLVSLRDQLSSGIELHAGDTLRRSAKEDAGDLSSYGQHMADAGTDTFDRDFALSLVSSEQEALAEINAAIERIHKGTYGICEITGQPIAKARLLAVPFTRYSTEAQKGIERNRHRVRTQAGLFGENDEDVGKMTDDDSGE